MYRFKQTKILTNWFTGHWRSSKLVTLLVAIPTSNMLFLIMSQDNRLASLAAWLASTPPLYLWWWHAPGHGKVHLFLLFHLLGQFVLTLK